MSQLSLLRILHRILQEVIMRKIKIGEHSINIQHAETVTAITLPATEVNTSHEDNEAITSTIILLRPTIFSQLLN